jgi:hypothetical protein
MDREEFAPPQDLAIKIEDLLDTFRANVRAQPLFSDYLARLRDLRSKAKAGKLSRADQAYIADLWDKFGLTPFGPEHPREPEHEIAKGEDAESAVEIEAELQRAKATIVRPREAGKRAVAQRDQWETRAKELDRLVANLRRQSGNADNKFEQAKRVFAKLYHPNAAVGRSPLEAMVRTEVFKEFWAELERIESEA